MKAITPGITALLGFGHTGPVIWDPSRDGHLALIGGPGTGKSTLAGIIAASLSTDAEILALTSSTRTPPELTQLRHVQLATTPQTQLALLGKGCQEMRRRLLVSLGNRCAVHKPLIMIIDNIRPGSGDLWNTMSELPGTLLESGRSLRIHLVTTGQELLSCHGLTRQSPVFLQDSENYGHLQQSLSCPSRQRLKPGQAIFVPAAPGKDPVGFSFTKTVPIAARTSA